MQLEKSFVLQGLTRVLYNVTAEHAEAQRKPNR